jgi:NodT family efflux transporter outer membrane factor (OMF) lipoprotein
LISEALSGSPDIGAAEARLREAQAAQQKAGAGLFPTATANGGVTAQRESLNQGFPSQFRQFLPHGWHVGGMVSGNLSYEIDLFGKNRAALAAATSQAEAAAFEAAEARIVLSTSVASTYADLLRLSQDLSAAQDIVRIRKQTAALVADRVHAQLENEGQLSEANAQVAAAQSDADALEGQIGHVRDALAALLGKGPDRGLDVIVPQKETVKAFGVPPKLAVDLVGRRPDIVAARLRAESASSQIKVAHAEFYPNIDITGSYGLQSFDLKNLLLPSSQLGQFGPAVHLPIFDGGAIESGYRTARAQYDEAVANYNKTLTQALQQVADAIVDMRTLSKQQVDAHTALTQSENAYRIANLRYRGGLSRYVDVLTAEDTLVASKKSVTDLEAAAFLQDVALVRALGGGFGPEQRQ